jgi:hypothetical protein
MPGRQRSGSWRAASPRLRLAGCASLGAIVATLFLVAVAFADATPVQLTLLYLPNVSNTGTPSASGIAELLMPEGEVRVSATDLPRLDGTRQYVAWVVNSESNQFQRIGAFNTSLSTGSVRYENVLPDAIPDNHWNLLLVTIEDSADATKPSGNHSIAGVFPRADNEPLPGVLPNTGGAADDGSGVVGWRSAVLGANWLPIAGLAALTGITGFGAGYARGRRRRPGAR